MDKKFISERVFEIRSSKNISARSLSLDLGMSSEYVNQVENGRMMPSVDFLINFCEYFNITLSEFFDCENKNLIQNKTILVKLNKLDKQQLEAVNMIIDTMIKGK